MEGNKKISIIVPIYNCEKYLCRCLDSIKAQDYKNFEAILIDDGSMDNSAELCKKYANEDARFIYIYKKNGGVSSARNLGLDRASGDYLAFVDGDDEITPDFLSSLLTILENNDADVSIISPILRINGKDIPYSDEEKVSIFSSCDAIKEALRGVIFAGHLCTKLFKASLFEGVRLREDLAICEDLVAVYDTFIKTKRVAFANLHKYIYYTNETSAINSTFKESFLSYITACEYLVKRVENELPEAKNYALSTLVNAYIDVTSKLYFAKRLTKAIHKEYRARLREIAGRDVLCLMPRYKRVIVGAIKGPRWYYALVIRAFNLMKKIIYHLRNK